MKIGQKVKKLRKSLGLTQKELAEKCGYKSLTTINKIELGINSIPLDTIEKLATALQTTPSYLMGWSDTEQLSYGTNNIYPVDNIMSFEVLGSVRAGYDGMIDEVSTGEIIELPLSMISGGHKDKYFVLQVTGNSMFPRLLDGDKILCKRTNSVDSGSLAVIIYNGDDATVKKVNFVSGEDWLELIPFNPEYETRRIEGRDLEQCRVIGKVVKLIRDL